MAGAYAVAAVGKAILTFLESACPRTEFPDAEFALYPKDFLKPIEERIALYLHRVTPTNNIRNLPPRTALNGKRYRLSPVDLHYLLIPYAEGLHVGFNFSINGFEALGVMRISKRAPRTARAVRQRARGGRP
jgi:hypothetical protein